MSATGDASLLGEGPAPRPTLFKVIECHAPLAPSLRLGLEGIGEVLVGRGEAGVTVEQEGATRRLVVRVDDPHMSSSHARFARRLSQWTLEDLSSKNGSIVNGERVTSELLDDGDVVELGRTFFVFRDALPSWPDDPQRLSSQEPSPVPGLASLLPSFAHGLRELARVAASDVPIVLRGETGTGKELAARAVHALSRRPGDLVPVNCGALPPTLAESELFGYRKGAFSGAIEDRAGLVRSADRGTLFLDEVADLRESTQAALLRVLQEREVQPLGATRAVPVDIRIVCATHRDLDRLVANGLFRHDLHARLAGFQLELPPLRERREDLGLLVAALLPRVVPGREHKVKLHPRFVRALLAHSFPANVRELEKALAAACVLAGGDPVTLDHAPEPIRRAAEGEAPRVLDEEDAQRRDQIVALLREHKGNVAAVARAMGKARMQIQRWIKRYGIATKE
jgi:DNA-binding NtrC family response regulator